MKNKKLLLLSAVALLTAPTLTSCGEWSNSKTNIGILQYVVVDALDEANKGFQDAVKKGLGEDKVNFVVKNAGGDSATNSTLAQNFAQSKADLLLGIATPSAQAIKNQVASAGKQTPVLFTAVTDPASAGLIGDGSTNVTGTSDLNPVAKQIDLFKTLKSDISKIGIIYCSNEDNSIFQKNLAQAECDLLGITLEVQTISSSNDIASAISSLVGKGIQGLYVPTDNICSSAISAIYQGCKPSKLPIICGEANMLKKGGLISLGVDYYTLGQQTGEMAVSILKGEKKPSEIQYSFQQECPLYVNKELCDDMGITLPNGFINDAQIIKTEA